MGENTMPAPDVAAHSLDTSNMASSGPAASNTPSTMSRETTRSSTEPTTTPPTETPPAKPAAEPVARSMPEKPDSRTRTLPEQYFNEPLFKDDNTGTDKLKGLLSGLKETIHEQYSKTDSPDLMPDQLASFYRDLDGDMDELFVESPNQSIAFIYKSLGCPYSLQPEPYTTKFVEPTIPALKSEGWIMWTTIQLLLGPEEHSGFIMQAVEKWDVRDPITGLFFPKTLPRECFPMEPDRRMADWYKGVSERLRKEAEAEAEEQRRREAMHRRQREGEPVYVPFRGPAYRYFHNPLYRHVDGRASIVRPGTRPALRTRPSLLDKAKSGVAIVGGKVRDTVNDHLRNPSSAGSSRERRRKSIADSRYHHPSEPAPADVPSGDRLPGARRRDRSKHKPSSNDSYGSDDRSPGHLRHSRSHDPTPTQAGGEREDDYFGPPRRGSAAEGQTSLKPPAIGPSFGPSTAAPFVAQVAAAPPRTRPDEHGARRDDDDTRRGSFDARRGNGRPDSFDARRDERRPDNSDQRRDDRRGDFDPRREHRRSGNYGARDDRRADERDYDAHRDDRHRHHHPLDPRRRSRDRSRHRSREDGRRRSREEHRPHPPPDRRSEYPPSDRRDDRRRNSRPPTDWRDDGRDRSRPPPSRERSRAAPPPPGDDRRQRYDSGDDDRRHRRDDDERDRRDARRSISGQRSGGSDFSGPEDTDGRRGGGKKQARFSQPPPPPPVSVQGVHGRQYVDEAPWR